MKIITSQDNTAFNALTKGQMQLWRKLNNIPTYVNASYSGPTGCKYYEFPLVKECVNDNIPDITASFQKFEEDIFKDLINTKRKLFGTIRTFWKVSQNISTGEPWDTKFLPEFPGRNKDGNVQYAKYKGEIVSANDMSNLLYGHICAFLGLSVKLSQFLAKLDATGIIEPITKRRLPDRKLLMFRDTASDQLAIKKGVQEFDIKSYNISFEA